MLDPVNPDRVRICTDYAGEAIGTLLTIMRRDDISPDTRMRAAKEVLVRVYAALPLMEGKEVRGNVFQAVHERQRRRALRREDFARRRADKAARRRNGATADGGGRPPPGPEFP